MHFSFSVSNFILYSVHTLKFVCVVLFQWRGTDHLDFCIVCILKAQLGIAARSGRYCAAVLIWACSDLKSDLICIDVRKTLAQQQNL